MPAHPATLRDRGPGPATLGRRLPALIHSAAERAARTSRPVLVSLSVPLSPIEPMEIFERAAGDRRAYWRRQDPPLEIAAVGASAEFRSDGVAPLPEPGSMAAAWRALAADACVEPAGSEPGLGPLCLSGSAFDPARPPDATWSGWPRGWLVVPTLLALRRGDACSLQVQVQVVPDGTLQDPGPLLYRVDELLSGSPPRAVGGDSARSDVAQPQVRALDDPPPDAWRRAVTDIVAAISRGEIEKLVLARRSTLEADRPFDCGAVLRRLRDRYGAGTVFALADGDRCFLGATPELLVSLRGRDVRAVALAGSAPRGRGAVEDGDRAQALLADPKERREHAMVVRALEDALAPVCIELDVAPQPALLRLPDVQHLQTDLRGTLARSSTALDLVDRLHPTPAVGGVPRERALPLLRDYEPFDRGWFAGPLGWMDARGNGDFVVAIRSALIEGGRASLYAGCGIVAGSDAETEYEESRLKMRSMRWALGAP